MGKMIVAAQTFTIREFMQDDENVIASLNKVKDIGYKSVQLSGFALNESKVLVDTIRELGINVCSTHIKYERFVNELDMAIEEHLALGCDRIGLGSMPGEFSKEKRDGFLRFIDWFNGVGEKTAKHGIKVCYHNHKFEFEKFGDKLGIDLLIENASENVEFVLDSYWIQAGGASPAAYFEKVKDRMKICHFKDMAILDNNQIFAPIGEGNIDFAPVMEACKKANVKYIAIEQDKCLRDPFDCLKSSYEYLMKNFGDDLE